MTVRRCLITLLLLSPLVLPASTRAQSPDAPLEPLRIPLPKFINFHPRLHDAVYRDPAIEKPADPNLNPLMVPPGTVNVALDLPVTASDPAPIIGWLDQITDGNVEETEGSWVELRAGRQWVQIDLTESIPIRAVALWHQFTDERVYRDVIVQACDRPTFDRDVHTLFNNDADNSAGLGKGADRAYLDTRHGKLIPARGVRARYLRLYTRGSHIDDATHWTEVQVYAQPGPLLARFRTLYDDRRKSAESFLAYVEARQPGSVRRDATGRAAALAARFDGPAELAATAAQLPALTELRLLPSGEGWNAMQARANAPTRGLDRLRILDASDNFPAADVLTFAALPALEEIRLHLPAEDFQPCLSGLARLKNLRAIHLVADAPAAMDLSLLATLPRLKSLSLANSTADDKTLPRLLDIPALEELDLSRTNITNAGLPKLQSLKKLRTLNFSHTDITDAGIPYLFHVPALTTLDLSGTRITPEALTRLRQRRPTLTVITD